MFFLRLRRILVGNCCCRFCVTGTVRIHKIPKTFLVKSKDRISLTESYAKRIIRTTKYTCTQLKIPNPRADCIDKNTKSETMFRSIFKGKNVHVYAIAYEHTVRFSSTRKRRKFKMKKKTISLLMAASLAASSLAGGIVSFAEEAEPITLSVWAPFTGSD